MKKKVLAVLMLAILLAMSMAQAAWAAEPSNVELYGIVVDGKSPGTWEGGSVDAKVTLFTQSAEEIEYSYASGFPVAEVLKNNHMGLLVKYVLNANGEISAIEVIDPSNPANAFDCGGDREIKIKQNTYLWAGDKTFAWTDDLLIFEVSQDDGRICPWVVTKSEFLKRGDFTPQDLTNIRNNITGSNVGLNNWTIPAYAVYQTNDIKLIKVLAFTDAGNAIYNYGIIQDLQLEEGTVTLAGDDNVYDLKITSTPIRSGSFIVYQRSGRNGIKIVYSFNKNKGFADYTRAVNSFAGGLITIDGFWTSVGRGYVSQLQPGQVENNASFIESSAVNNVMTNEDTVVYGLNANTGYYEECSLSDITKDTMIYVPVIDRDGYAECVLIDNYSPKPTVEPEQPVPVTGVSLNETALCLEVNGTAALTATVSPENATNKAVRWSSSNTSVATVNTVGQVTAVAPGTATITVTTEDGGKTAACAVTVTERKIPVTSITLSESALSLEVKHNAQLTASVLPADTTSQIAWASSNEKVALVDSTGKVTAVGKGAAVISAEADGIKAECAVTVTADTVYTITFDTDGGTLAANTTNPDYVTKGEGYKMPGASKSGYTLTAWAIGSKTGENKVKANEVYTFTQDTTVYAVWEQVSSSGGGGGGRPATKPGAATETKPGAETGKPSGIGSSKEITAANIASVFADVQNNAWYSEAIAYVYNNKTMNGTENGFEPNAATTRAMIVTMLHRLAGEPGAGAVQFADVPGGQWFSEAVAWAAANGVVNGYSETQFAPNEAVTREQLAAILYRYAEFRGYDVSVKGDLSVFSDSGEVSAWAAEAMQWAVGKGVINGDNGTLRPSGNATRAEVAMMFMRYLENVVK